MNSRLKKQTKRHQPTQRKAAAASCILPGTAVSAAQPRFSSVIPTRDTRLRVEGSDRCSTVTGEILNQVQNDRSTDPLSDSLPTWEEDVRRQTQDDAPARCLTPGGTTSPIALCQLPPTHRKTRTRVRTCPSSSSRNPRSSHLRTLGQPHPACRHPRECAAGRKHPSA